MDEKHLRELGKSLKGELHIDEVTRRFYATDASAYRELPQAVAIPKDTDDIKALVNFANKHGIGLIPRTGGTSLAGQVVGSGIVVDVSKYFNQILEINKEERWVRVQPGMVRDDLNKHLSKHGLLFGPETSTASRAMIGGMIGNNSCGSNSIVYGSTREHLIEADVVLSDGNLVKLKSLNEDELKGKCNGPGTVRQGTKYL